MTTIENSNETPKIIDEVEIKDANNVDLSTTVEAVEQTENWWKKWKEEAMQHIKKWEIWAVVNYFENYEWLDNEVAMILIKNWELEKIAKNLNKFCELKYDTANTLITHWKEEKIAENIKYFDKNAHNKIAHAFLKFDKNSKRYAKNIFYMIGSLDDFVNLDDWIAQEFIKIKNMYKLTQKLTNNERYYFVPMICLDPDEPVWWAYFVWEYLKSFKELSNKTAKKLIESWNWINVAKFINKFEWVDYNYVCDKLIEQWEIKTVIENINTFKWIDEIKLIEKARELWVDYKFIYANKNKFSLEWNKYIMEYEYTRNE